MKKIKFNYYLAFHLLIVLILTFLAGYFLPVDLLKDNLKIFEIFLTIFAVALTLFTFIQGVVQNSKNNLLKAQFKIDDAKDKFIKLDAIIDELKGDVFYILLIVIVHGGISLFFGTLGNMIWQHVFVYIKYLLIFTLVLLMQDLTQTMFKLVKINNHLNLKILDSHCKDVE